MFYKSKSEALSLRTLIWTRTTIKYVFTVLRVAMLYDDKITVIMNI